MFCRLLTSKIGLFLAPLLLLLAVERPLQEELPRLGDPPRLEIAGTFSQAAGSAPIMALAQQAASGMLTVYPQNRENAVAFFQSHYSGAPTPAINWTGNRDNCNAGSTALAFRDAVELRVNFFRAMGGVPAWITFSDTYSAKAQMAALMMSANGQLNHYPPADWLCYTADGYEAAHNSNLAIGAYGWESISLYMQDPGSGNGAAGHRRWILYPQTQLMGTGDISPFGGWASNDLWVFDSHMWETRPPTRDAFVAWPPPGYVPYQLVYPRWSFAYPSADFSQASVTLTLNQQNLPLVLETVRNGYGENTLVWIPNGMSSWDSWPKPAADTRYRVTVGNVIISGNARSFSYDVTVVDPAVFTQTNTQDLMDFDGDARTDISVWRPDGGIWYSVPSNSPEDFTGTRWGLDNDVPVPGDYDGDRQTDVAVWRPSTGVWYIQPSSSPGNFTAQQWGVLTDRPVPADYDGDGKTDLAVWRPGTGVWYVVPSSTPLTFTSTQWGSAGDLPVPGNYDGDLKADIAVQRPASGVWYVLPSGSSGSFTSTQWGSSTDTPVPADYDGDGEADIAVWRASTGIWYVLPSNSPPGTYTATCWGLTDDTPSPADYDGDGKADIGIWRQGTGVWYVLPSKSPGSYSSLQWGIPGDLPLSPLPRVPGL